MDLYIQYISIVFNYFVTAYASTFDPTSSTNDANVKSKSSYFTILVQKYRVYIVLINFLLIFLQDVS